MSHFQHEFIEKYLDNQITTVLDIGSYDGKFGIRIKEKYNHARVICVEADKTLYEKMRVNKNLKDIEVFNYVVCETDGSINFYHNTGEKKGSGSIKKPNELIYKFPGMQFSEAISVNSITLESLCRLLDIHNIDLLHMDVQSAEYEVLCGLKEIRPKLIFLEVSALNFYDNTISTKQKLIDMGYENINISHITKGDELWILKK